MGFNHFRIVILILVSFSSFFAFMTKFNLSLVIGEMVANHTKTDKLSTDSCGFQQKITGEEQAVAALAINYWQRNSRKKPNFDALIKRARNRTTRSIDIDLAQDLDELARETETTSASGQQLGVTQTTEVPSSTEQQKLLNWDEEQKNWLLGAFFYGYIIVQIPAGLLAGKYGAKTIFLTFAIGSGCGSLLFPLMARISDSIWFAIAVRIIIGITQAGLFPAIYMMLCDWLPKEERANFLAIPSAAGRIGTIAMNMGAPWVSKNYGWDAVFYLSGCVTLVWGLLFLVFASNSPATSRWVSERERTHIESRMEKRTQPAAAMSSSSLSIAGASINNAGKQRSAAVAQTSAPAKLPPISWHRAFLNVPLCVLTYVMFTSEWSNLILLVKLSGFLGPVFQMEIDEIALWNCILLAIYCVQYPLSSFCAARIERAQFKGINSLRVRKMFEIIAHSLQATGCLLIASFQGKTLVITSLIIIMIGRATVGGGQCLMPPELSKDYQNIIIALANTFANLPGAVGPSIITLMVGEQCSNYDSWRGFFLLSAAIFISGGVIFCLFAQNEQQNYGRRPKGKTLSTIDLVGGSMYSLPEKTVFEEVIRMDSFARVASEPAQQRSKLE